jgi:hypothetical protein
MAQVIVTSKQGMKQQTHGGVRFFQSPVGLISEEVSDEKAEEFLVTPDHFKLHLGEVVAPAAKPAKPAVPAGPAAPVAKPHVPTKQGQATAVSSDPTLGPNF